MRLDLRGSNFTLAMDVRVSSNEHRNADRLGTPDLLSQFISEKV